MDRGGGADGADHPEKARKGPDRQMALLCLAWLSGRHCGWSSTVLYDANVAGNAEKYAAISKYVVFNDAWGTNRGYAWIRSMEVFKEFFTTKDKIFGYGPETFAVSWKIIIWESWAM